MRILHVIASIDPTHGGPSTCAPGLAAAQAHAGHDVTFVYHRTASQREIMESVESNVDYIADLTLVDIPQDTIVESILASNAARTLRGLIASSDVVHIHGIWDPIVIRAAGNALALGKQYVITPHGMLNPWSLSQSPVRKRLLLLLLIKKYLKHSLFIHALNDTEADAIRAVSKDLSVSVFPNGIFASRHQDIPPIGLYRNSARELAGHRYFLFLGRLHHVKGLDYVAEAFARVAREFSDVHLVVAGPDDGALSDFQKRIASHGASGQVHVVGPLYGEMKYAALSDAMCLVQPSRQEGFSMSILEAMACGTPVVISQSCHFPQVETYACGKVVPLDVDALAAALAGIAGNPSEASQMGVAARDLVLRNYTWDSIGRKLVDAYQRVESPTTG